MALTTVPPSSKEAHGLHLCLAGKVLNSSSSFLVYVPLSSYATLRFWFPATEQESVSL